MSADVPVSREWCWHSRTRARRAFESPRSCRAGPYSLAGSAHRGAVLCLHHAAVATSSRHPVTIARATSRVRGRTARAAQQPPMFEWAARRASNKAHGIGSSNGMPAPRADARGSVPDFRRSSDLRDVQLDAFPRRCLSSWTLGPEVAPAGGGSLVPPLRPVPSRRIRSNCARTLDVAEGLEKRGPSHSSSRRHDRNPRAPATDAGVAWIDGFGDVPGGVPPTVARERIFDRFRA